MLKTSVTIWDRLGIGLSAVCLIHCLALPVVVSLLPMVPVPEFIHDWSHPVLAVVILPTIVQAIRRSAHDRRIHAYLIGGFVVILTGWAVGHSVFGALSETLFTVAGSVLLIIGHVLNYRHHRVCKNTQHHHHPELEQGRAEGHLHEHSHGHEQSHEHVHSHDHGHAHHHPH